ncbi:MAG: hypothetical protein WAN35_14645 [Terracidiphilus sp.]
MHTREPENEPKEIDTSKDYEQSDASVSGVVVFLVALSIVAAVIGGIAYGMGKWMNERMSKEDGPTNRWTQPVDMKPLGNMASSAEMKKTIEASTTSFPMPRVQTDDGNQDVADLHLREDLLLENYSWLGQSQDQAQGKVRIPIERAMELVAQRGLPVATAVELAPLMTGDDKPILVVPLTSGFARTGYELDQAAATGSQAR